MPYVVSKNPETLVRASVPMRGKNNMCVHQLSGCDMQLC